MANQFSNAIRFLKAVNLLISPHGTTIKKLAGSLGISRRSVFRLFNTLEELGFPLAEEKPQSKNEKTYRLADAYVIKLPNIAIPNPFLTADEIMYITALLDTRKQRNSLHETRMLNSINEKLKAMLPAGGKNDAQSAMG